MKKDTQTPLPDLKELLKLSGIPVLFASMCCLSPLLLFVFGVATLTTASSLTDLFYGQYVWWFRGLGLFLFSIFMVLYFRKKGICTLDQAKRKRNQILNTTLLTLLIAVLLYLFFLYVVVHYAGVWLNIWE